MKTGWEVKKLEEVCSRITDGSHFSPKSADVGEYPYVTVRDIDDDRIDFLNCKFIDEKSYKSLVKSGCKPFLGDVLFSKDGTVGKVSLVDFEKDFVVLSSLAIIRPKPEIISPFLLKHILKSPSFLQEALGKKTGAAIRRIILNNLKKIEVRFPKSLPEQQRIVAILDEAFAAIDQAKANAQRNLQNARELFDSYLQSVFANPGEEWETVKLSELATDITDGDHMPPPKSETGVPFITISNINKETNKIDFSDTFMVSPEYYKNLKANRKPRRGDVLYTVTGSFGIPVIVESDNEFCFQRHIGLIRPKSQVNSKWLYYLILSPQVFKQGDEGATGTAQRTVSLSVLRNFSVPKISLEEQKTIVAKLDTLSAETKKLEAIYQQKLMDLEELKKSILQKAFRGELSTALANALAI